MRLFSSLTGGAVAPPILGTSWFNIDGLPPTAAQRVTDQQSVRFGTDTEQLIVVNFWNYESIECGVLIPTLRKWWQELAPAGLLLIGIHSPSYAGERQEDNVQNAVLRFGINYPVVNDPDLENLYAWRVTMRPHLFLVNKEGRIRKHIGSMAKLPQFEAQMRNLLS